MTNGTTTLLPCPFCGGEASHSTGTNGDGSVWPYIECVECAAMAEPNIWNKRAAVPDGESTIIAKETK